MRLHSMFLMLAVLLASATGNAVFSREGLASALETATGPEGLLRMEQQGTITVRALRGWGRLPDKYVALAQRMRQEASLDLLGADLTRIRAWITQAEAGDAALVPHLDGLKELAGFMEGGEHLEWSPVQDVASLPEGALVRQDGKRWTRASGSASPVVEPAPVSAPPETVTQGREAVSAPAAVEGVENPVLPSGAATAGLGASWAWPVPAPERIDFDLPRSAIDEKNIRLSDDMRHIAWIEGEKKEKKRLVLNGLPGKWYDQIRIYNVLFTPQGESMCYQAELEDKEIAVCNGVEGPAFDQIETLAMTPDGKNVLVAGRVGQDLYRVFLNGAQIRETSATVSKAVFSPDARAAWIERGRDPQTGAEFARIVDSGGLEGRGYAAIHSDPMFTPDKAELYYIAAKEDELRYLVRNEEELLPTMGYGYKFSVTPDSSRFAYVSPCGENVKCMVINGKIGPEFTDIWDPARFSADGTRHGYEAKRGEEALLIVDDREVSHGYGSLKGVSGLTFSPDSKRWAAAFTFGEDEYAVLVDGKEIARRSGSPRKIVFSPDGSRVAWLEKQKDVWHALLDGQPGPDVREIFDEEPPQFSPDGENLVYFFRDQEDRIHLANFGKEERVHEIIAPRAVFTPGGIDYMAIDGTRFRRESIPIQ